MADLKSETTDLLANECKEDTEESPVSDKDYHSFDANSVDSNKTLIQNNESTESVDHINSDTNCAKNETNFETKEEIRSQTLERPFPSEPPISRPFFTLPRLLSGRRKRMKRKGMVTNETVVASIEEQPETDSNGHLSSNTTNTYDDYRKENHIYVKESFFMRLMRHLASPVHGGHGGQPNRSAYYSDQTNSTLDRRRSKRQSFTSSVSNGDINKNQLYSEQNQNSEQLQSRNFSATNGFETPAVCGIKNHGNTCFMNAIIQCLCNTDLLAEYFVMNHYRIDLLRHNKLHARKFGTKGELTEQLALLLKSLWSCMYSSEISSKFKSLAAKYNSQYEGSEQHDAQEFLLWLLDKCHEDLNIANKKKYKKIKVKIGVSIESLATIRELRDKISRLLKIPEKQLILLLVGQEFGLKELSKDSDIIQETLEDMENIFAVETPKLPQSYTNSNVTTGATNGTNGEQQLTLVWTNRVGIGSQGRIFGPIFSSLVSREASYKTITFDILKTMRTLIKTDSDINIALNLRLRIFGGLAGKAYLPEDVDHPLYMPTVDKAMSLTEDKDYRGPIHLKLMVEWDLDMRDSLIISDDQIDEPFIDSSIELAKARSQKTNRASLRDCFDMYFKEERLVADNAWICPSCRRRQQCTKKLSLWSVPDIFIIHLKRFRQSSHSHKVTTQVMFPLNGLEMTAYIAPRFVSQTNGNINNGLPALWSPLKRSRILTRLTRTDDNTFDLYAVCNHRGNMQSGHYTAYCRNPIDNCWYLFDDTKVVPVSESSIVTSDAYILFYHRSSLSSALSSCASSSTSGYSSSAGSYYSDQINTGHWAHRMPPFNYWSPKTSKSHDNISEVIKERAKSRSASPPTPSKDSPIRDTRLYERHYASLPMPSKSSQLKTKSLQTECKTNSTNNYTNYGSIETQTNGLNPESKQLTNNCLNSAPNDCIPESKANESEKIVTAPKTDPNKYWAITSV